jgi:hypothetical protein
MDFSFSTFFPGTEMDMRYIGQALQQPYEIHMRRINILFASIFHINLSIKSRQQQLAEIAEGWIPAQNSSEGQAPNK